MAIAVGDILQITDVQALSLNQLLNVYTYEVMELGSAVEYADIANTFQGTVVEEVCLQQVNILVHTGTVIRNLTNGLDLFEEITSRQGDVNSEAMPNFVALAFRLVRSNLLTRHGQKRIGGIGEVSIAGNIVNPASMVSVIAMAAAIGSDLTVDSGGDEDFVLRPVIVGRFPEGSPSAGQYDLSKVNPVAQCSFIRVTTQTTRRAGRGS